MCNWINKTNVNGTEVAPRYAQVTKLADKLDKKSSSKKKAIKVITMGDASVMTKAGRTQLVSRESSRDSKEDGEPGDMSKSMYSTAGVENLGRKRGVLSGCSTKRRQATFGVLSNDFNEALKNQTIKSPGRFGFINTARKRAPTTARNLSRPQSNVITPATIPTSERHLSPTFLTSDMSHTLFIEDHRPSKSKKNQFLTMRKMSQGTHHRKPSQLNSANRGIKII